MTVKQSMQEFAKDSVMTECVPACVKLQPDSYYFVSAGRAALTSVPSVTGELQLVGRGLN